MSLSVCYSHKYAIIFRFFNLDLETIYSLIRKNLVDKKLRIVCVEWLVEGDLVTLNDEISEIGSRIVGS